MEGYWLTHFEAAKSHGDGISILHNGELMGGDLEHLWSGTYEEDGPKLSAQIRILPVVSWPEEQLVTRDPPMVLLLSGYCTNDFARLEGSAEQQRDLHVEIVMRKCKGELLSHFAVSEKPEPLGKKV